MIPLALALLAAGLWLWGPSLPRLARTLYLSEAERQLHAHDTIVLVAKLATVQSLAEEDARHARQVEQARASRVLRPTATASGAYWKTA